MSYPAKKRHRGTINAYCLVKKASMEKLHTLGFQLYDLWGKAKLQEQRGGGCQAGLNKQV